MSIAPKQSNQIKAEAMARHLLSSDKHQAFWQL